MSERVTLHTLRPNSGSTHSRKRVGRGQGSGRGKTSGRGQKGAGARSGRTAHVGFEGGQMPLHMRLGKLRGPHMKKSMPIEPFRKSVVAVNVGELERLDSETVTPESLRAAGLVKKRQAQVKILGEGELKRAFSVTAHGFSASAKAKIEAAGGKIHSLVPAEPSVA